MKKILSLLMLMLLCTSAWAADETVVFSEQGYENGTEVSSYQGTNFSVTFNKGTNSNNSPKYYDTGNAIRVYGGNYFTVSSTTKTISEIVIVFASGEGSNAITTDVGTYENGTWLGSASSVTFTINGTSGHRRIASIAVTFEAGPPAAVATPVISFLPSAPYQGDETTCTITCATEGAAIQYSTDGETYQNYSAPFTLTETTTVYAKATLGDDVSEVAEMTVTFTPITTVADIAALTILEHNTEFRMAADWSATVVYVYNNFVYIKDNSGSTLLYDVTQNGTAAGNTISNLQGKVTIYNGLFEVGKPATYTIEATPLVTVNPVVMAVGDITAANANQYVKLEGVTLSTLNNNNFTINETLQGRHRFNNVGLGGVDYPNDPTGKIYNVTGFVGINNNTLQFWPTAFEDVTPVSAVEKPVIAFDKENPVEGETVNCTITCETQGATIMYALGEGDFQAYTAAFPLTETTTVKAKATKGGAESNVATATITFAAAPVEYGNFQLVTSENDLEIDKNYVIVTTAHDFAMGALTTGSNPKGSSATGFTLNNNIVTLDNNTDVMVLKLGKTNAGDLTLAMPDGKYINLTATSGTNITASESATTLTIAIDEDAVATIQGNTSRQILYQYGSANVFGNYASSNASNTTSYCTISLYKETEEVVPQPTYTITLDKQPGEYATLINVKATVEPALPEGATLKYTIDDADPVAYDSEKGVSLLKSSVLKFTAYDAQNNALTDPVGGQYKYIVNVFGDMDGDGEVTVTDLNIVLNLILGKI